MNVRSRALLNLAHALHECTNCGRWSEHGLEPAHENGIAAGKGFGIKGHDHRIAALCNACHSFLDQGGTGRDPSGLYRPVAEDKRELWLRAHLRTFDEFWKRGWLKVVA